MLRPVKVEDLEVGMYVAELDRPWLGTPFLMQGFNLESEEDIKRLVDLCKVVKVDAERYEPGPKKSAAPPALSLVDSASAQPARSFGGGIRYPDKGEVEDELPAAREALSESAGSFKTFWSEMTASRRINIDALRGAVNPMVDSVLRNKDALVTLMRVQRMDRHTHEHCMALAVWGCLLGRQLGLPPSQIKTLALGCSLVDIGKVRLPDGLLHKRGPMTPAELTEVRAHVGYSLEMLGPRGQQDGEVVATVRWHHERMDGSGYPDGLSGQDIPMFARIAGIVDSYDAMISPRSYGETNSSYGALVELQDLCPTKFQPELVDQFAQAIGLFPNGCLVELSSGEVGVVCGQNAGRRLRPKVMLILDAQKQRRRDLVIIDLKQSALSELRVSRELAQNEYGIDAREYFL